MLYKGISLYIILHSTVNEKGSHWVLIFCTLNKMFFIGLMMTVYVRNTQQQCNLLHTLYYYIDIVVYWRYTIFCTIAIAQRDGFCQKSLLAYNFFVKEYFQLIDFWTRQCTFLFSSIILNYDFLARHPTHHTFIYLQISVTTDNILCIMYVFYQLLFILISFKVSRVKFNSLAAAELYSAGNTQINECG